MKQLVIFIVSVIMPIFITGCYPVKPEPVTPLKEKPVETGLPKVEAAKVEHPRTVAFHGKCTYILNNFVDDSGMVDYSMLKRERAVLKQLLEEFDELDSNEYYSWPQRDKIAFWINAYNIQLLNIILKNYPIESSRILRLLWPPTSIRHIKGIWNKYKFIVMDEEFVLSEIERRFFRNQFDDPRIFFAITQASFSSPSLRNEPYCGYKLEKQLDDQAQKFLSSPRAFNIDRDKQRIYLSAILQRSWYGKEFISKYGTNEQFKEHPPAIRAVLNFITDYVSKQDKVFLSTKSYSVKFISYDWRLNEKH